MKKVISMTVIVSMLLTALMTFSSCAHKCEFSDEWKKNDSAHWHECSDSECSEISDRGNHTWNDGEIILAATEDADGTKVYTCSVCTQTKSERILFEGYSEAEWNAALDESLFFNFTYTEIAVMHTKGISVTTTNINKYDGDKVEVTVDIAGTSSTESASGEQATAVRNSMIDSILTLADFEDYTYNPATKSYDMIGSIKMESLGCYLDTCSVKFKDGKLSQIRYTCKYTEPSSKMEFDVESTIEISKYGTTVIG